MITLCVTAITFLGVVAVAVLMRIPAVVREAGAPPVAMSPAPARTPEPSAAMPPSRPVLLEIPRLRVRSKLVSFGRNPDGSPQVPAASQGRWAGWYRYGAAPGSAGPAIIAAPAGAPGSPAAFHRLGELVPGDEVTVLRRDRKVAVFLIERVERVEGSRFPARRVYGRVPYPELRLITWDGGLGAGGGQGRSVIAYGRLVRST
ncbi:MULTISPECIES: sortase domain-containing protein [Thermomonospora]|uniref:Peptidase C60 sortase A and B n=1 Tax=Thermomonospora curvata (strain ATCC 19995 / DSM 43183 / JCM 3096 / KCTC 9072 / NBRC 15933 / NCIMB 10081 / Henssen B9) TaxID=471852 RepID=D1A748_THECD|nr:MULTISPECIES: sortase [Thermomonospora]ACZ00254.1 peptidase C60 sortase A and B [Thermomonospora curvata DSM 43183]PKK12055.1 MAG: class F sortase [Thermomonospora sp. CIF 1]